MSSVIFCSTIKNKKLLQNWIHKIGHKKPPINSSTRVCSDHFVNATGCCLCPDEYPSVTLPVPSTTVSTSQRKPPKERYCTNLNVINNSDEVEELTRDISVSTEPDWNTEISELKKKLNLIEEEKMVYKKAFGTPEQYCFRLRSICNDDSKVAFYTGFPDYTTFMACFNFLGPAIINGTQENRLIHQAGL